jgi:CRISPR-associated protein Cas6
MRMFNPEWEAIKGLDQDAAFRDIQFDLVGAEIPADHGYPLFRELAVHLPWLVDTPGVAVHPVHGAPSGRNDNLVINRRVKLVLRVPKERIGDMPALVGKRIDPGAGPLVIGALKERPLIPYTTLYAHFVDMGDADEIVFLATASRELANLSIPAGMICGKRRKMMTPEGSIEGFSLMLHDVKLDQSLQIQEHGLGGHRGYGCGIFIPHKSIKEVAID